MMTLRQLKQMDFIYLAMILVHIAHTVKSQTSSCDPFNIEKLSEYYRTDQFENNSAGITQDLLLPLSPIQQIQLAGYPSQTHLITTEDGYVITIFRIPGSRGSTPVYLMHGLEESAADWLASGKGTSLAYILHDAGYDVWLGNARGNTFSKRHVNLTTQDSRFWNFSFTEVGMYDLPAAVNYINNWSGKRLFYIGHSMGGTFMSIMAIERPDVARKVKAMIGLGPGPYVDKPKSLPLLALAPVWKEFYELFNILEIHEWLRHGRLWDAFATYICGSRQPLRKICSLVTFILAGYSPENLDYSILQKLWRFFPAGTSVKLYVHYLQQQHRQTRFSKFDYGEKTNLKIYKRATPPAYDVSQMRIPTAVFYAEKDIIVVPQVIKESYSEIPIKLGIHEVPTFNHFDFLIAKDAPKRVYSTILKIMSDFEKNNN